MTEKEERIWAFKLCVLGDPAVGKTSLINRYIEHSFEKDYHPTLGVNTLTKEIKIEEFNAYVRLILWDIAGQDKYELTRQMFFEGCHGSLLIYDITRHSTFDSIKSKWLEDFRNFARPDGVYMLIGNKVDLKDSNTVLSEKGENLAKEIKASDFIETSTKSGNNVESAFKKLVSQVLKKSGLGNKAN